VGNNIFLQGYFLLTLWRNIMSQNNCFLNNGKDKNKLHHLQAALNYHINSITKLINDGLVDDGDIEADSQRLCVLNRVCAIDSAVNGITVDDLKFA
jgi:hypothetical protein